MVVVVPGNEGCCFSGLQTFVTPYQILEPGLQRKHMIGFRLLIYYLLGVNPIVFVYTFFYYP
jgi:hypothetical protein